MKAGYPTRLIDRIALAVYDLVWLLGTPVAVFYLWRRGRREPTYFQHLNERFGRGDAVQAGAIWVHAVSLGELRAARPLLEALLARGERVLLTTITAAGRDAAQEMFAPALQSGQMQQRWAPMDGRASVARFFRHHQPRAGIILEIELWPGLIAGAGRAGCPLFMAQAQYPKKSYERDAQGRGFRRAMIAGFDAILAKSETHGTRFTAFGAERVIACGEMRFEQPVPPGQLAAASTLKAWLREREVFCLASTHPDEDALLLPMMTRLKAQKPGAFFVYVPRHPQHFGTTWERLSQAGFAMLRRSEDLGDDLSGGPEAMQGYDGLFGDSLGELNFYFALSDRVFMGDSLIDEGSHNIIEPLALNRPVVVGPSIWGIEYPAVEALEAGVLAKVADAGALGDHWRAEMPEGQDDKIAAFVAQHGGATERIITALMDEGVIGEAP